MLKSAGARGRIDLNRLAFKSSIDQKGWRIELSEWINYYTCIYIYAIMLWDPNVQSRSFGIIKMLVNVARTIMCYNKRSREARRAHMPRQVCCKTNLIRTQTRDSVPSKKNSVESRTLYNTRSVILILAIIGYIRSTCTYIRIHSALVYVQEAVCLCCK